MNSALMFRVAEGAGLVLVMLVAMGLAVWPRRRLAQRENAIGNGLGRWACAVAGGLVFPLLALGLGWALLRAPHALGLPWAAGLPESHRDAWVLFWAAMAALNVVDITALRLAAAGGRFQIPALLRGVLRGVVTAMAALFVLRFELGWNITPLLASTALVTAVVGFALQGVLGNLLAGMSLNLTGTLSKRDWVVIDDLEGQVDEMNWRETWILTRDNIPVRIPNSKVADARIRNLSRPEGPRRCSVFVDASYGDPPDAVIAAMLAAAAAVPDVRRAPPPTAFVLDYKSYGVGYQLRFWLDRYPHREPIMGEVRRHIWYQFRRAGIQIPYPVTDQVLNDFMERAIVPAAPPAGDPEAKRRAAGLLQSEFARKVLQDAQGKPLVDEAELSAWAAGLASLPFGRGEFVFRQGDSGDCCYVVLSGALEGRIRHGEEGKISTFEVGAGSVVGEMSLVTGLPRMADIRVVESAELLRIPAPAFAALLGGRPGLVEQLSQLVADRVQHNRKQYEDLLAADAGRVEQAISSEGILRRFWRLLGGE
jgi:small-conductance mechanosensitive channel/CRP-like cAMP-binding protein